MRMKLSRCMCGSLQYAVSELAKSNLIAQAELNWAELLLRQNFCWTGEKGENSIKQHWNGMFVFLQWHQTLLFSSGKYLLSQRVTFGDYVHSLTSTTAFLWTYAVRTVPYQPPWEKKLLGSSCIRDIPQHNAWELFSGGENALRPWPFK